MKRLTGSRKNGRREGRGLMLGSVLVNRRQLAASHEPRPDGQTARTIVLHYTGMASGSAAVDWLCNPVSKVSCHYLVDVDGSIVQMVAEDRRAWHAGFSGWRGRFDVNSSSIGIEIQNGGHAAGLPEFPLVQMQAVAALCLDIMARHGMGPADVVGHSDVAPGRKIDPGEAFDWLFLARHGVGQMVVPGSGGEVMEDAEVRRLLRVAGFGLEDPAGKPGDRLAVVISALQRHYRPRDVSGVMDAESSDVLRRLAGLQLDGLKTV
jgi:N-acetylmuramoyl-L-alanine amidase